MARSKWKFKFFSKKTWRDIHTRIYFNYNPKLSLIYYRNSNVPKCFSDLSTRIHKGNISSKMRIVPYSVGYKFGEFSFTRKPYHFPKKNRK